MIRAIRNEDHRIALEAIERLWSAAPGTPEHDALEVLAMLVDAYERTHHAIAPPDPLEGMRFRAEQLG